MKARCRHCRHFLDDAAGFERALPGILILSSGAGDTRGDQGLCRVHSRMALPDMECDRFEVRLVSHRSLIPRQPGESA